MFLRKWGIYSTAFIPAIFLFELTNAQKRVLKEIRRDLGAGRQMNRLLQGDVGERKDIGCVDEYADCA